MITTLTGANDLLRRQALDRLIAAFVAEHTDMGLERFDGEETTITAIRGSLASLPFLTSRKLVVLREPGKLKAFTDNLAAIFADTADTTDVIIYEPKLDKRLSYYKTLKKDTDFQDFTDLDAAGLARWAADYAHEQGGKISQADAKWLIDRVGPNQMSLQQELHKLMTYTPHITRDSIEQLTEPLPQSSIFALLDAAFAGNTEQTFRLYREQRALRVEPQAIIAMLAWQLHVLALVVAAAPRSAEEVAKAAGINPFVVRKTHNLARRISLADTKRLIADLLALDMQLKRAPLDADEALQLYLLRLTRI